MLTIDALFCRRFGFFPWQWEAENAMREIYPDTIVVRCAHIFGYYDCYTNLLLHKSEF